jgi:hypothetical protein
LWMPLRRYLNELIKRNVYVEIVITT